ncbi:histidine kinase [Streptomyces sp. NPDC049954]|uniref:sensor histidine kinase n=1 Tax=Streptomyces sp. NPDC049954 TaxID=3155779 RepID=UPI00342B2298
MAATTSRTRAEPERGRTARLRRPVWTRPGGAARASRSPDGGRTRPEYPWLLPSAVLGPGQDPAGLGGPLRRTPRDWCVDTLCFLFAVLLGFLGLDTLTRDPHLSDLSGDIDIAIGALSCCAVWLRRRWPLGLAIAMLVAGLFSETAGGAAVVSLFTLTVHRPFRYVAWIGGLTLLLTAPHYYLRPDPDLSLRAAVLFVCLIHVTVIGWGMFVRARRQLVLSLRERARRAEAEAALRAEHAQRLAREDIAREMHDVLAHRLSLLSVHAGALEFRPDAPQAEVRRAAGVIRDSAHEALQDLRQIIGVLRTGEEPGAEGRPQPTFAALGRLAEESRTAGARVVLDVAVTDPAAVPAALGRNVYRVAQEGLTNARKHAPGAEVTVRVHGGPGEGLSVEITHPAPPGRVEPVPGSGQGLIGLRERAALAGGRTGHGPLPGGGFRLSAWLPWAS